MYYKFTDEERFREINLRADSIADALTQHGVPKHTCYYKSYRQACTVYNLQVPQYKFDGGQAPLTPLNEILVENSSYSRTKLKERLLENGMLRNECYECAGGPEWNGKSLVLQLEHKNGINNDNRLENLAILCPNCHSQTDTFSGRNRSVIKLCIVCQEPLKNKKSTTHQKCISKNPAYIAPGTGKFKIEWPSIDELLERLKVVNYVELGKELGVTDNTIRKHIAKHS